MNDFNDTQNCWYLVYTRLKQEIRTQENLKTLGVDVFFPQFKERRLNSYTGSFTDVIRPLFPNYLFARFNLTALYHKVQFTRGVRYLISFDNRPSVIDDSVIDLIQSRIGRDGLVRIGDPLEVGDEVVIRGGPFKDLMGIFERETKDSDRVMILLQTANYQAYHLVVDRALVQKRDNRLIA